MKELLLFVMLVALCALWYDDRAQRFQERLHEPPALGMGSPAAYNASAYK